LADFTTLLKVVPKLRTGPARSIEPTSYNQNFP